MRFGPLWVAALAFAVATVRAATLSITYDEAWSYLEFARPGWTAPFQYNQNNHVLNSLLMRLSTELFGASEFSARLPALMGAALYLSSTCWICLWCLPGGALATSVMALVSLNPLVLDFLSLARGTGMALGFLSASIALFLKGAAEREAGERTGLRWLALGSVALGLCVCANLAFAIVAAGLAVSCLIGLVLRPGAGNFKRGVLGPVLALAAPGAVVSLAILGSIIPGATAKQDYTGFLGGSSDTVRDILNALFWRAETAVRSSATYHWNPDSRFGPAGPIRHFVLDDGADILVGLAACLLAWTVAGSIILLRLRRRTVTSAEYCAWYAGFALAFNWIAYGSLHYMRGFANPADRHALFLVPLFALTVACAAARSPSARRIFVAAGLACLLVSLARFDPRYFRTWMYDAGTQRLFATMERYSAAHAGAPVKIGSGGSYVQSLKFYRAVRNAGWIADIVRTDVPLDDPGGFSVFHPDDVGKYDETRFETMSVDPVSQARLVRRKEK